MKAITWGTHDRQGWDTRRAIRGAAICVIFAGLVHVLSAPQHLEHVGHALFLTLAGVTEVAWGLAFWRKPSAALRSLGVVLAGAFILLWAMTRVVPAPFGHGPGDVEVIGIISKIAEAVGLGGLLAMILLGVRGDFERPAWKMVLVPLTLAVIGAVVLYGAGLAAERTYPWLGDQDQAELEQQQHSDAPQVNIGSFLSYLAGGSAMLPAGAEKYGLAVWENGSARALNNGGSVTLADGVVAEVFFAPFPVRGGRTNLNLYVIQSDENLDRGTPQVEAEYAMVRMNHGTETKPALELQQGHYLLPLDFAMSGEWAVDLRVSWTDETAHLMLWMDIP